MSAPDSATLATTPVFDIVLILDTSGQPITGFSVPSAIDASVQPHRH